MPRLELPSGAWVEYTDRLMAGDKLAVHKAIEFRTTGRTPEEMVQFSSGATVDLMRMALLERIITDWSFEGIPIPSKNVAGAQVIEDLLDIDDMNALEEAVEPLMVKVAFSPGPNRKKSTT